MFSKGSQRARTLVGLFLLLISGSAITHADNGSVLPPTAAPQGYSLDTMLRELAQFQASFNNEQYYPQTPFQILYIAKQHVTPVMCPGGGKGVRFIGTSRFVVHEGTQFFMPVAYADNTVEENAPSIPAPFPTTLAGAVEYFFGPAGYGGRDFQIVVDGQATAIGPGYLAGPATFSPTLVNGATAAIQLGAFVSPLSEENHRISLTGGYFGTGFTGAVRDPVHHSGLHLSS